MNTLHELATQSYSGHYARMNPTLQARQMPSRLYRNMELTFGAFVNLTKPGDRVLDIGCGAGFLLHWLARKPGLLLHGVDACHGQAALARQAAPESDVVCADAIEFLQSERRRFAGVFCLDVLEHMKEEDDCLALLEGVHRILSPGGFFVCRVPNAAHILGSYSRYLDITHRRSFTCSSLRQVLEAGGFERISFIPTRSSIYLGKLRLGLEYSLHRLLFLLGGHAGERTFSQNVIAVGFKG